MNVLVFFAHPDDETILSGGTLALLARQGAAVYYLCATRGEGGEAGDPPLCTREELGEVRENELTCAVRALGGTALTFLDYIDPTVGADNTLYPYDVEMEELVERLVAEIRTHHIEVLLSHGSNGEYGHPGHVRTHEAARRAIEAIGKEAPLFYTFQAAFEGHPKPHVMNPDDPADLVLDIGPVLDQKINAALCHRTQHALFIRRPSRDAGRPMTVPEVIVSKESLRRIYPAVKGALDDKFASMLRESGCVVGKEESGE
jgi:LmbE family N-acetylglucosaminyl deacetylase